MYPRTRRLHIPPVHPPSEVVVVGAGAAGLLSAIAAAEAGAPVRLLERTEEGGRKILISGGGRCNVLPSVLNPHRFVTDSPPHLLRHLLASWPLAGQRAFFEETLGIPLAEEPESGKLFPRSDRARDIRDGLRRHAASLGVTFQGNARMIGLDPGAGGWQVLGVDGMLWRASAVVLATGGASVPNTGSDGAGFELLRRLGHTVHETYPALTPLTADPPVHAELAGVSLPVRLTAGTGKKSLLAEGGFLITHKGYSGPAVLDVSHLAVRSARAGERQPIRVQWSRLGQDDWANRLGRRGSQLVSTVLREELPARLVDRLLLEAGTQPSQQLSQLKRAERLGLIERLTRYPLPWTGDEGYRKAEVTGGGLSLEEVDRITLESRRCPGLFVAGELLDAFGPIGGYNFAWAWATGRAAGRGAASRWRGP